MEDILEQSSLSSTEDAKSKILIRDAWGKICVGRLKTPPGWTDDQSACSYFPDMFIQHFKVFRCGVHWGVKSFVQRFNYFSF